MGNDDICLNVGALVDIEIPNKTDGNTFITVKSQILDILDPENYILAAPIYQKNYYALHRRTAYQMYFTFEDRGLCRFLGTVVGHGKINKAQYYKVKRLDDITLYQRRSDYRLPLIKNVLYKYPSSNNPKAIIKLADMKKCFSKNISGSGICIIVDEKISTGDYVDIVLSVDKENIPIHCLVQRINTVEIDSEKKYELGMSYINLSKYYSDMIVKFIFQEQRLLIKERRES